VGRRTRRAGGELRLDPGIEENDPRGARREVPVIIDKVLRTGEGKTLRQLRRIADQVNSIEEDFTALSDAELRAMTDEFRCPRRSPRSGRPPGGRWASGTSTCS
jgi:hypothetical protein